LRGDEAFQLPNTMNLLAATRKESAHPAIGTVEVIAEARIREAVLKTGALQNAILKSANFSSIANEEA
jgi:hypothetical protein